MFIYKCNLQFIYMSGTGDKRFNELLSAYLNSSLNREESGEFVELL